jgi:hypothetical protein
MLRGIGDGNKTRQREKLEIGKESQVDGEKSIIIQQIREA